jgi:hypothetical protein
MLFAGVRLIESRRAATDAAASLAECRRLASRIGAQRGASSPAAVGREPQQADVVRRIESAAKSADVPPGAIERIEPLAARRVGDSPAREKPTAVMLRGVTLRQTFTFLHAIAGSGTRGGLQLRQVHLAAPNPDEAGDAWSVEGTVTYPVRSENPGARPEVD